jgi:acetylornithine deacetylase/succinyl-diaminopimelate desuccinylase-like protein
LATDAHSAAAATVPSAAWRLVEALTTLRGPDGTVHVPGFYDSVKDPTAGELRTIAAQSETVEHDIREVLGIARFIDGLTGAPLRERASFAPTCNIAGIKTGYSGPGFKTVLPAAASAWLDFRLVPDQQPDEILALLHAHLGREGFDDVEVTVLGRAEAAGTPVDHPIAKLVVQVAEDVSEKQASINPRAGGSLPIIASLERHVGVPGVGAPGNPVYFGSRAHAPNEHVRLEDIGHATRFTHALFERLAETT